MKRFFAPNLEGKGRVCRFVCALILFAGAAFGASFSVWLGALLLAGALFATFEAFRGWCLLRACGIKTRL